MKKSIDINSELFKFKVVCFIFYVNAFHDNPSITTLNGTWKVISFEDFATERIEFKTDENSWGHDIVVTFDDSLSPQEISGHVTTNTVAGEFEYVGQRQFKVTRLGATSVGQPEWADKFEDAILHDNPVFIIDKNRLRIYYDNKAKSVTLVRV